MSWPLTPWEHAACFDYRFPWMKQDNAAARFLDRFGAEIGGQQNPGMPFIGALWQAAQGDLQSGFHSAP